MIDVGLVIEINVTLSYGAYVLPGCFIVMRCSYCPSIPMVQVQHLLLTS